MGGRIVFEWKNKPEEKYGYQFKSQIERKWADYLEIIKSLGAIISWKYEPTTFKCGSKYRKERIYTPDFLVVEKMGYHKLEVYHEVKTNLRQHDISRFKWLANAHPEVKIVLILPYCSKGAKQTLLRQQALKYVMRITYTSPLFKQFGIK